jgi:hypothetical protein
MRNHTDTQLVSDVNLLGTVSWRRWPRPEVIEAGEVLFRAGGDAREVFWLLDGAIKLVDAGTTRRIFANGWPIRPSWKARVPR